MPSLTNNGKLNTPKSSPASLQHYALTNPSLAAPASAYKAVPAFLLSVISKWDSLAQNNAILGNPNQRDSVSSTADVTLAVLYVLLMRNLFVSKQVIFEFLIQNGIAPTNPLQHHGCVFFFFIAIVYQNGL